MKTQILILGKMSKYAAIVAMLADMANFGFAQGTTNLAAIETSIAKNSTTNITRLPEVIVEGRQDSLLGIADSANQGTTGAAQLAERPILRSGEILETVPGVIITQHAGGGKANQ